MTQLKIIPASLGLGFLTLLSTKAFAHVDGSHATGITNGLFHSFSGYDHLLAMVAVGILANKKDAQHNRLPYFWLLPLCFMAFMALGAASPLLAISFSPEILVNLSLAILGGFILLKQPLPIIFTASVTAVLAFCHGFAHGSEIPQNTAGELFILGAVSASGILHAGGFLAVHYLKAVAARLIGLAIALAGLVAAM